MPQPNDTMAQLRQHLQSMCDEFEALVALMNRRDPALEKKIDGDGFDVNRNIPLQRARGFLARLDAEED